MLPALATELRKLKPVRRGLLVLRRRVIPVFAIDALQRDDLSWHGSCTFTGAKALFVVTETRG
jgi:hypothetical protein